MSNLLTISELLVTDTMVSVVKLAVIKLADPDPFPLIKADSDSPPAEKFTLLTLTVVFNILPSTLILPVWIVTLPKLLLAALLPVFALTLTVFTLFILPSPLPVTFTSVGWAQQSEESTTDELTSLTTVTPT